MALIPPHFVKAVVAIGNAVSPGATNWIGTAFFYGVPVNDAGDMVFDLEPDVEATRYATYLVTNRHVYEALTTPMIRANPAGIQPAAELPLTMHLPDGTSAWAVHPDPEIDVAVTGVSLDPLIDLGYEVSYIPHQHSRTVAGMAGDGFAEGDGMFIAGFPMGLVGVSRVATVIRGATLAQFSELRDGYSKSMLVDGYVFPGNSGGPAFTRGEHVAVSGTQSHDRAYLVGIVAAFIPYTDVAISAQTQRPRVTFEENSGLSRVFPVDAIVDTAISWAAAHPAAAKVDDDPPEGLATASPSSS